MRPLAGGRSSRNSGSAGPGEPQDDLEGWWVDPDLRRTGVGRQLVAAAEDWARAKGCREMASDTDLGNDVGITAHLALGYQQVGRVMPFNMTALDCPERGEPRASARAVPSFLRHQGYPRPRRLKPAAR